MVIIPLKIYTGINSKIISTHVYTIVKALKNSPKCAERNGKEGKTLELVRSLPDAILR